MKSIIIALLLLLFSGQTYADKVWIIPVKGAIGPAISDYIVREIEQAKEEDVSLVILKLDTPGGLDSAMRDIIRSITTSNVPVATWVGPSGARAASAGTYILLASHIAAMAPATNLGASTPVQIGGANPAEGKKPTDSNEEQTAKDPNENQDKVPANTTMEKKVINDARAYIKGLAKLHGRNAQWAEKSVSEAASLDAEEALALNVIDYVANSPEQLIELAQGKILNINSVDKPFKVQNPSFETRQPDWRAELLAVITNPNVAYILMLIGIYGLLLEFYNPGFGLPGVLGGICLLIAMYALQMMPVNYAGLALLLLGIALMAAEGFSPSFGILGLGGVTAFVLGSIFLMDSEIPGFQIALPLILGVAAVSALIIVLTIALLLRIRKKGVTTGIENLAGQFATVTDSFEQGIGRVQLNGALWTAKYQGETTVKPGDKVEVTQIEGLILTVKKPTQNH